MAFKAALVVQTQVEPNRPFDVVRRGRINTRIWRNQVTARRAELKADFKRLSDGATTPSFSEWELLEIADGARRAWKECRRFRRRQRLWAAIRRALLLP